MSLPALYAICLVVGFLVGGTGMGGILVPPALVLLSGLDTHTAMATTLASFIPMNVAGIYLFNRLGHLPWKNALPLLIGGSLSAAPCALINIYVNATFLTLILSFLVLFAGFTAFRPQASLPAHTVQSLFWQSFPGLFCIGLATGTVAGLTGAGGPLLAIAWMVATRTHPLTAVGLSMPYSLATAVAASAGNAFNHTIDYPMLWHIASLEGIAFLAGVFSVQYLPVLWIRRLMAVTCTALGLFLFGKCLFTMAS